MALLPPNQLLHLGPDPSSSVGWNHFDLGLGLSSHINYPQSALGNTPPQGAPWWYSKTNSAGLPVVQFSAPLNGATTSTNTQYARCELREYERNGTTKAAWNPKSGDHWIEGIYKITGLGPNKSGVCVQQAHDPSDDTIMVRTEGSSGSVGLYLNYNGTRVATLTSSYSIGTEFYLKIRVNAGTPSVYYTTNLASIPTTPFHTSAGYFSGAATGWYFKSGCYNQSNESTDSGSDPDASIIKVEVRELKHWHSETPLGGAWPTPATYAATSTATVNAGADASILNTGTFSRTATVTLNGSTLTSQEWKILSGPGGVGSLLSTAAAVSWNPSAGGLPNGTYVLQFTAVTSTGNAIDTVSVTVSNAPADTTTAAGAFGWGTPVWSDEFNYTGAPDPTKWSVYNSVGHDGNGTRSPSRVTVTGGKLVGTGLANGDSFGMESKFDQRYGRWELRARCFQNATSNGNDYHTVFIIWPQTESWPQGGEYDFVELGVPGQQTLESFIHFPHDADQPVQQRFFSKPGVDTSQYHHYAIEWTANDIVGYVDGVEWFRTSGGASSIRRNIQDMLMGALTIQLDNFDGTNQTPATVEVDWVRVYTATSTGGGAGEGVTTYPSFVSAGPVASSDGSGTVTVAPPPGVLNKHFQICIIQDPTEESITSVPAGWQLLDDLGVDNTDVNGPPAGPAHTFVYYNTTGDSATRSWSKDGTRGYHAVRMAWKDWSVLGEHLTRASAFTTTPYAPTVDPTSNSALVVTLMGSDRKDTGPGPVSVPGGWTQRYNAGVTVNSNEIEWIAVADIQSANRAPTGGNAPGTSGLGTSNFSLTNADNCACFSFVLEGITAAGTTVSGGVQLTAGKSLTVGAPITPVGAGSILLTSVPTLSVRALARGQVVLPAASTLTLAPTLFPRGALIILPNLLVNSASISLFGLAGIQLLASSSLWAGALPYRKPVLRTDYVYPPRNHPFRLIAQRILDGEIVEWELPVDDDFEYVEQLSGPTVMKGTFKPELIQVQELNLDGYAYWLHVEVNQQIRASAIMLPPQYEDTSMAFAGEGISAAPHYHVYDGVFQQIQVDPLSVVRTIWNYVQSQPQSDLGVVVSNNSSPVRLGETASSYTPTEKILAAQAIMDRLQSGDTIAEDWTWVGGPDIVGRWNDPLLDEYPGSSTDKPAAIAWLKKLINDAGGSQAKNEEAKPYELVWWNATNCGEELDTLSGQTPFDYIERHAWNSDRTDVLHYFDMGYPRIGKAQPELLFNEENILEVVPMQEDEDSYASAVLVIGAGDGEDTIRGYAAQSFGDRVRKEVVITDKSITDQKRANARALTELAIRRGRTFEIAEIVIAAYHTNAPIGSYRAGDDIPVSVDIPWLMETHIAWYRITSISNKPSSDKIRLGLSHANVFDYSETIVITPTTGDDYLPFEPPSTEPTKFPGNIFFRITQTLSTAGTHIPAIAGASLLTASGLLSLNGAVFRTGAVNMVSGKTLTASGIASAATSSQVSLISNKTLSVGGASTQTGAVSLSSSQTLSATGTPALSGAVVLSATPTLIAAAGTVLGATAMSAPSTLTVNALPTLRALVTMVSGKTLSVSGVTTTPGTVTLTTAQALTVNAVRFFSGTLNLVAIKLLTVNGTSAGSGGTVVDASVSQRTTGANNTATATHTVVKPSGVTSSQGILVCFTNDLATVGADTTSTGWVKLATQSQGTTTNHTGSVFWAANASTAVDLVVNLTTTATGASVAEEATWGVVVVDNPGVPEIAGANGSGTTPTAPVLTTAATGDYLSVVYIGVDSSTDTTFTQSLTPPTGYTNLQTRNPTVTSSAATFTMERLYTAVSSITPGAGTLSLTEQWVAFTVGFPGTVTAGGGGGGGTGVAFDAVGPSAAGQSATNVSSTSWSHTCTGTNRYLTVGVAMGQTPDTRTLAVTYGGVAMTPIKLQRTDNATSGYIQLFGLVAPSSGANTVAVTVTGGTVDALTCGSVSFNGVDQSNPLGTPVAAATNGTTISVIVPGTTAGNMVVDAAAQGTGILSSGKTNRWKRNTNTNTGAGNGAQSTSATPGGSVTMSYTSGATDYYGLVAVEIKAAP